MNLKKIIYIIVGCMGVGLGAVGAVIPMLPWWWSLWLWSQW